MKKIFILSVTVVVLLTLGVVVFADSFKSPSEIYSSLKGISVEEAYNLKGSKTFGELAKEDGFYEEFQSELIKSKKALIEEKVNNNLLTREEADEIIKELEECDGTNIKRLGQKYNLRFGQGQGYGKGLGSGQRKGFGKGQMGKRWQSNN